LFSVTPHLRLVCFHRLPSSTQRWLSILLLCGLTFCPCRARSAFAQKPTKSASAAQAARAIPASDEQAFAQAMQDVDQQNFPQAQRLLVRLRSRYPENFQINEALGLLYAGQGRIEQSLPLLAAAARAQPDSDVAHVNLGTAYFKLQRTRLAAQEFERATQLNPANGQAQSALGQAWMLLKQPAKAAAAFNAALKIDPSNPDLLYNGALADFDAGQSQAAAALLARMPGVALSAPAQSLYGDVEERLGHYKSAAEHYSQAAELDPSEANVYVLGIELLRHWTFDPAIQEFAAGTKRFPDSQRMRFGLAVAYYGNGNYDQAIDVLAGLMAAEPDNAFYANLLGRTCTVLTEGTNPQCSTLIQFARQHPRNATLATYAAASILHRPSNPAELQLADDLLRQAIAADPRLPQARFQMGALLQTESKWAESVAPLEAAVRLKPDYAQAHYRLALAYSHIGKHAQAQQQIALDQQYSKKQEDSLNARMKEITTLVVRMQ
jgi:tetratricopeptide (TPR) repeat protein